MTGKTRGEPAVTISDREVREAIRASVIDPEIGLNIVDLGLIYGVEVEESSILIDMTLTSPGCPAGPQIIYDVKNTVKRKFPEANEVAVNIVWQPFWSPEMMSEWAKEELGIF
ncbi:MAG: metal-sulfur cluster assembly factor [Anaerolineae bacterium]|nr:metal-sulfur cluster assembly factor [Anaerolineae bacterium]MCB0252494.1 metal-sulfur cluster assembly factor [Anaerolineae bacterium]